MIEYEKEVDGTLIVHSPQVNGHSWKVRRRGVRGSPGTYVWFAAPNNFDDDVKFVVEEYDNPQLSELWEKASDEKIIEWAYGDIDAHLEEAGQTQALT